MREPRGAGHYRKEYDQALQDYQRVLEIDPKHKLARARIVNIHVRQGNIDQAIEVINQAIARFPDDPDTLRSLGGLHLQYSGDYEQALRALLRSDELDPNNQSTLLLLGAVYLRLGDEKLGKSYIEKFAIMKEQDFISEMNLYQRTVYKLGVPIGLNNSMTFIYRGMAYSFIGYSDLARSEFERFIEKGGSPAVVH